MRGVKVSDDKLVVLNTKLEASTKELMAALVFTQRFEGYRELFNVLLDCYRQHYPNEYETALKAIESRVEHRQIKK